MNSSSLRNARILVVEDEYMLADDLATELRDAGASVLGPVGSMAQATALAEQSPDIDGALLDINLNGEMVYPIADRLTARGVEIMFVTGYDRAVIPERFADVPRFEKPLSMRRVADAIGHLLEPA